MKYKDKVVSQLDITQNRVNNIIRLLNSNAPISKEQMVSELTSISKNIEYISDTVGLEANDFSSLAGKLA